MKRARQRTKKSCYLCGSQEELTSDHIPPANLFPRPRDYPLITVPACRPCNEGFAKDDEYFRMFLLLGEAQEHPLARRVWDEKVVRSKGHSPGLWADIRNSARPVEVISPAGIILGRALGYSVKSDRVERVVEKTVRGLYRHHLEQRLPRQVPVRIWHNPQSILKELLQHASHGWRGHDIFRYSWVYARDKQTVSIWWLQFYRDQYFICLTGTPD